MAGKELSIKIFDSNGTQAGEYKLDMKNVELDKGSQAVHEAVVAHLAEIRAGTASTKTRTEVRGGGAKPFRQKGTGRARAGSIRSPIWRHGGISFGPKPRSYDKKMNKKVLHLAVKRAFSERVLEGSVSILDSLKLENHKTKNITGIFKKIGLGKNVLIIVKEIDANLTKASSNLQNIMMVKANAVNTYQLLLFHKILVVKDALDVFVKRLE